MVGIERVVKDTCYPGLAKKFLKPGTKPGKNRTFRPLFWGINIRFAVTGKAALYDRIFTAYPVASKVEKKREDLLYDGKKCYYRSKYCYEYLVELFLCRRCIVCKKIGYPMYF